MSWPPLLGPLPPTEQTSGPARLNVRKGSTAAHHRPPLRTASLFVSGRRCGAADPRPQQSFRSSAFPDDVASSALLATTSRLGSRRTGSYGGIRPRLWRPLPALTRGHPLLVSALLPNAERGIAEEIATSGTSAGECVNARPPPGSRSSSPVWAVRQAGTPRAWRVAGSRPALPSALARPLHAPLPGLDGTGPYALGTRVGEARRASCVAPREAGERGPRKGTPAPRGTGQDRRT